MVFTYTYDSPAKKLTVTDSTVYDFGDRSEFILKLLSDGEPVATFNPDLTALEYTVPADGLREFSVALYTVGGEFIDTYAPFWLVTTEYAYEKFLNLLYPALDKRTGTDWFTKKLSLINSIKFHTGTGNYLVAKDLLKAL